MRFIFETVKEFGRNEEVWKGGSTIWWRHFGWGPTWGGEGVWCGCVVWVSEGMYGTWRWHECCLISACDFIEYQVLV
jgi:hypothetical protein